MRFVVTSSDEYLPYAEMAMTSIRHHHPTGHIVHLAPMGTRTPEVCDEAWYSAEMTGHMPSFLVGKFRTLAEQEDVPTAVLDADTLTCKPLDSVWERDFDVALATRLCDSDWGPQPYNSGVIFCRTAKFWQALTTFMESEPKWSTFGGDQQALAVVARSGWKFVELPGTEWHNYSVSKHNFPPGARVCHYKGRRRKWMHDHYRKGLWK